MAIGLDDKFCRHHYELNSPEGVGNFYCKVQHDDAVKRLGEDAYNHPEMLHKICDRTVENVRGCPILREEAAGAEG